MPTPLAGPNIGLAHLVCRYQSSKAATSASLLLISPRLTTTFTSCSYPPSTGIFTTTSSGHFTQHSQIKRTTGFIRVSRQQVTCQRCYINPKYLVCLLAQQNTSAKWRAYTFSDIESRTGTHTISSLVERFASFIIEEFVATLECLPGNIVLPSFFSESLALLLQRAYNLNCTIKLDTLEYALTPFIVEPSSLWDPTCMEPFERSPSLICFGSRAISLVSLGLIESVSVGRTRKTLVHRKAGVLVDEPPYSGVWGWVTSWMQGAHSSRKFSRLPLLSTRLEPPSHLAVSDYTITNTQPGRTTSMSIPHAVSRAPPPATKSESPLPFTASRSSFVSTQPGPTPQMTILATNLTKYRQEPPSKVDGRFGC